MLTLKSQISNLNLYLRDLQNEKETNPKVWRRKKIIKLRTEINEIGTRKIIKQISEIKSEFFERITKLANLFYLGYLRKKNREGSHKIINEKGDDATNSTEMQRIMRWYYEQLHANKLNNLKEIDKFLGTYNLLILNHIEAENMNRPDR